VKIGWKRILTTVTVAATVFVVPLVANAAVVTPPSGPEAGIGINPIYGTAGMFRTFSAETLPGEEGVPTIGVNILSAESWINNVKGSDNVDLYLFPTFGVTIAPVKQYIEIAGNVRAALHYIDPVETTRTKNIDLGDMNMAVKGHFSNEKKSWASLGAIFTVDLPTGRNDNYSTPVDEKTNPIAEGEKNYTVLGLASKRFFNNRLIVNLNGGYRIRTGETEYLLNPNSIGADRFVTLTRPDEIVYGVGIDVRPLTIFSVITEFTGSKTGSFDNVAGTQLTLTRDTNFEGTLGIRLNSTDRFYMGLGVTKKFSDGWGPYSGPDYKAFLQMSVDLRPFAGDRDKDGLNDKEDACPDDPEDYDNFEDWDGCPEPDNDQDGILDVVDQCPNDPEDKDGFKDDDGCPDPDNDNDGILDINDKCPNDPEDFNGYEDEDGCPEGGKPIEVKRFTLEDLRFKPDSSELVEGYYASLEKAGEQLKEHPEITVTIEGHAASTGRPDFEMSLSRERAEAVKNYLVRSYGIDASRITTVGYGSTKPIADNSTEAGRKQNRRIEYVVD
jgi:outer membrane protein OmpA-like peptidoglycan-associated protein